MGQEPCRGPFGPRNAGFQRTYKPAARVPGHSRLATDRSGPHDAPMIGTLIRFMLLRVIGARGAALIGVAAWLFGRRRRDEVRTTRTTKTVRPSRQGTATTRTTTERTDHQART
jgi:hypothetical protein